MAGCTAGRCRRIDGGVALDEGVSGAPTPVASIGEGFRGSSYARRGAGLGTTRNPGTRASGEARPTGLFSATRNPLVRVSVGRATLDAAWAWVPRRIQERGRRAKPDPRGCFQRRGIHCRGVPWVEPRSTRRRLGYHEESRNAGVGRSPTHGGCFQR